MKIMVVTRKERVAPVYDSAGQALLFEFSDSDVIKLDTIQLPRDNLAVKNMILKKSEVNILICGAISKEAEEELLMMGVEVYSYISGEVNNIVYNLFERKLENSKNCMPGCRGFRYCNPHKHKRVRKTFNKEE